MNAIERMIDFMIENKIYSTALKIQDQNKVILFISDAGPYIENKQIRVKQETDHIKIILGPESLKHI